MIVCDIKAMYIIIYAVPTLIRGPGIKAGSVNDKDIVLNIDVLPTFLDLAGIKYDTNTYDGKSWVGKIIGDNHDNEGALLRETMLTQYMSIGTYLDFSFCPTWWPNDNGSAFPGQSLDPPCCNDEGQAWMIDDETTNNWRALRMMNGSVDVMYSVKFEAS